MKFKTMKQVEIWPDMSVNDLIISMKEGGFTCRKTALAVDLLKGK